MSYTLFAASYCTGDPQRAARFFWTREGAEEFLRVVEETGHGHSVDVNKIEGVDGNDEMIKLAIGQPPPELQEVSGVMWKRWEEARIAAGLPVIMKHFS